MPRIALAALLLLAASADVVIRTSPRDESQLRFLQKLKGVEFWKEPTDVGYDTDIMVASNDVANVTSALSRQRLDVRYLIHDVEALIAKQHDTNSTGGIKTGGGNPPCIDQYTTYEATTEWMRQIANSWPQFARFITVGTTLGGAPIYAVQLNTDGASKPGYYIDGGIHAREWIAPAVVKNLLIGLIDGYVQNDPIVKDLVESFEWTFVPVLNVDGYRFTWTNNRMWRKTRRPNPGGSFGVDANRNSDIDFGRQGSSNDPASDIYHGPYAFSEPCVLDTVNWMRARGNVKAYLNLHSYGEEIIIPYAYSLTVIPADRQAHLAAGRLMHTAIQQRSGKSYDGPRPPNSRYSGFLMDYVYASGLAKYSGLIELPDTGQYGFLLPASQICTTSLDILAGVVAHAQYVKAN